MLGTWGRVRREVLRSVRVVQSAGRGQVKSQGASGAVERAGQ